MIYSIKLYQQNSHTYITKITQNKTFEKTNNKKMFA